MGKRHSREIKALEDQFAEPRKSTGSSKARCEIDADDVKQFFYLLNQITDFLHSLGYEPEAKSLILAGKEIRQRIYLTAHSQVDIPKIVH